ncbi:GTP pyrophosphokinase family protein [uncultured Leifsonia sp.]|uniref:GTP pyrophosphokinase n=1 Tax=Leifsonia sp. TaxID=1870902 RepID=UPI0028D00518|nr:GTP pyrophosphokinase family protein [uncultured Leifsonia sp.]
MEPDPAPLLSTRAIEALQRIDPATLSEVQAFRDDFARFIMPYKFGIDEVSTKVSILREEFAELHDYNPIEHIASRLKSAESIEQKVIRKNCEPSFEAIKDAITDIAGVRIICSFVSDVYRVFQLLTAQEDINVLRVKDYIAHPKPNGYKSLHVIVEVPVFLSDGPVRVPVEVQLRTVAMDFWASLEHKIYYKYEGEVPAEILRDLTAAAGTAAQLDVKMEDIHRQVRGDGGAQYALPISV